jgi:hypothetical protein
MIKLYHKDMRDFLSRHSYIIIWVLALIIIGSIAILIIKLNGTTTGTGTAAVVIKPPRPRPQPPAPPPAPVVSITIQKSKSGNSFVVQWENLPNGTIALEIFRGKTGTDPSTWSLWKTITLTPDELASGKVVIDIGSANEAGYSFYEEAVNGSPDNGSSTSPLWTSSPIIPIVTTSTPPDLPPNNPPQQPPNNPTPSSTNPIIPPDNASTSIPTSTSENPPQTPTGTPYYNPQVQISSYGSPQSGNFWVQHVDNKIQIGWQNLPAGTNSFTVSRSADQNGPWDTVITQINPNITGPDSIQVVDDTLGQPYYYQMTAQNGNETIATYGPVYLAPGQ